jgi:hypothetical protein
MGDFRTALPQYAQRFHAALPPGHHVASPLGAWLVPAPLGLIEKFPITLTAG